MGRKSVDRAAILPAMFLCTQLAACSLSIGSNYDPATQVSTSITRSWHSTTNVQGQKAIHAKHAHNLARSPDATALTEKHCNTSQNQESIFPTAQADKHIEATPQIAQASPSFYCRSIGQPKHNRDKREGSIVNKSQTFLKQTQPQLPSNMPHEPELNKSSSIIAPTASVPEPIHSYNHFYKKNSLLFSQDRINALIAHTLFELINKDRTTIGLPMLQWSDALALSASKHNLAMAANNQLSHQLLGELPVEERESQAGVKWTWAAENIGVNSDETLAGALFIHDQMMAEQPPNDHHRLNILSSEGTMLGIDVLLDPKTQKMWITEDFART